MSIFDDILPLDGERRQNRIDKMRESFNEICLFTFDVGRVIGFHEDLKDYYWVVLHPGGKVVHHSAVSSPIFLRNIEEYTWLEYVMGLNGAPPAPIFSMTSANRAANIAMYGEKCFRGDIDDEITEENYLINLWFLLNELNISEDTVPETGRVEYTKTLREKAYARRAWADLYKLDVECVECGKGKYVEATLMDSFSGRLTCTACRNPPPEIYPI